MSSPSPLFKKGLFMDVIEDMRLQLRFVQSAIVDCIDDNGYVQPYAKRFYAKKVREARDLKESIEYMEKMRGVLV
jgi:predicted transcriptional regulator of viral defense system